MKFSISLTSFIVLSIVSLNVCKTVEPEEVVEKAVCVLLSPFTNINGLITFYKHSDGILVNGKVHGLTPGPHGLHIHEKGDIRDPKCSTVGGHYNPFKKQHGDQSDITRHLGDLGNIHADEKGTALFSFKDKELRLEGPNSIVGRALVIHERMDDLGTGADIESKTTGNSGERIACAVIGYG